MLMSMEKIQREWKKVRNEMCKKEYEIGWSEKKKDGTNKLDETEKDVIRDQFIAGLKEKMGKERGVGFFSSVRNTLSRSGGMAKIAEIEADKRGKLK